MLTCSLFFLTKHTHTHTHGGCYSRANINQFAPGILLVFLNRYTGLYFAKNPPKILAINKFFCQ